jgi:hypothetical protein
MEPGLKAQPRRDVDCLLRSNPRPSPTPTGLMGGPLSWVNRIPIVIR